MGDVICAINAFRPNLIIDWYSYFLYNREVSSGCSADGSARGLGPWGRRFKSCHPDHVCKIWPVGQAVKTSPFHGGNGGSIPPWVTILECVGA